MPGEVHLAMVDGIEEEVAMTETEGDMEAGEHHVCTHVHMLGCVWVEEGGVHYK